MQDVGYYVDITLNEVNSWNAMQDVRFNFS
jgi:hypothetical protein